jgi:hypothetical protein
MGVETHRMHRAYIIDILLVAALLFLVACPGPVPETTPVETTTAVTPTPEFPPGMGAFQGNVIWGDKPVVHGTVVADTKPPAIVVPPWEDYSAKYKQFVIQTDENGNYLLFVEPDEYYLSCSLPGSDDFTYESYAVILSPSYKVASGEVVKIDLKALDWSIELISPGDSDYDTDKTISENPPTLAWKDFDWGKYGGEVGYYQVELGIIEDGYHVIVEERTDGTSYKVPNALEGGKYNWEVRAYTQTDKELAGTTEEFYFLVP